MGLGESIRPTEALGWVFPAFPRSLPMTFTSHKTQKQHTPNFAYFSKNFAYLIPENRVFPIPEVFSVKISLPIKKFP